MPPRSRPTNNCSAGISFVKMDLVLATDFPNASKTWLVMKDRFNSEAEIAFAGTNVRLTSEGRQYLGSAIGSSLYIRQFVEEKVNGWSSDVTQLTKIPQSQPHAAYSAFNSQSMDLCLTYCSRYS